MKERLISSLALLGLTGFMANVSTSMITPIIAVYSMNQLKASASEVGLIISAYYVSSALWRLLIGVSTGGRSLKALILGLLILASCPIAYVLTYDAASMISARLIHGLGFSLFTTMGLTLTTLISSENEVTKNLGRYTLIIAMGLVLGPALGAVSISLLGQYETFILSSCIGFFGVSLSCVLNTRDIQTDVKQLETIRMKEIPEVLANQSFQKSFLAYFAFSFMYGVVLGYVPVRAQQDFGFSEAQITALFFGYFLVVVSSRFFVGRLVAKFSEGNSLLVGLLTGGVFTLMVSASVHSIHFSLAFILLGICHGIVFPVSAMIIAKSVPLRNLTLSNSLYLISFDAGATVGPLVASAAVFLWGIRVAIAVSAVPFFLNIPLVIRKKQVKPSD